MKLFWKSNGQVAARLQSFEAEHPILFFSLQTAIVSNQSTYEAYLSKFGVESAEEHLVRQIEEAWKNLCKELGSSRTALRHEVCRRIDTLWEMTLRRAQEKDGEYFFSSSYCVTLGDKPSDQCDSEFFEVNRLVDVNFKVRKNEGRWMSECRIEFGVFKPGLIGGKMEVRSIEIRRSNLAIASIYILDAIEQVLIKAYGKLA